MHQRTKRMEYGARPYLRGDLVSVRRGAAAFLDSLPVDDNYRATDRENWLARWTNTGDAHSLRADVNIKGEAFDQATDALLCALTAFEVARRLAEEGDPQIEEIAAKADACIQSFRPTQEQTIEQVHIPCSDQPEFRAYYLAAGGYDSCASAVICISAEQDTGATLLGRLLPVIIGRGMSALVVSHEDVSNYPGRHAEILSCCLDFLSVRPEVDANRIGVYGDGLSAVLTTDFTASNRRVAAAVCDGGLWKWARSLASIRWITKAADDIDQDVMSIRRSQFVSHLKCPILVVAGGRGIVPRGVV